MAFPSPEPESEDVSVSEPLPVPAAVVDSDAVDDESDPEDPQAAIATASTQANNTPNSSLAFVTPDLLPTLSSFLFAY
ncbi:MAG: hypothetical protein J0H06_04345 [Actinobacteria bacterium]|nr:hypothetical protein [Actinomycetota bacterium]